MHAVPGLEAVVAQEIAATISRATLAGAWKRFDERTSLLEFRSTHPGGSRPALWAGLGTAEDVFVLAARAHGLRGNALGALSAAVLTSRWLDSALAAHVALHGPSRTFRVVARMSGRHPFRRVDAQRTVERALAARLPRLRLDPDSPTEFWLSIVGETALLGLRLTTPADRKRPYKQENVAASLKPSIARSMALLSGPRPADVVLDPCCGAGTLLVERGLAAPYEALLGGDLSRAAVRAAQANARLAGVRAQLRVWDAQELPLEDASVDVVLTNPPFGRQYLLDGDADAFYMALLGETARVLRTGGHLVLLVADEPVVRRAQRGTRAPLTLRRRVPLLVRGLPATILVMDRI